MKYYAAVYIGSFEIAMKVFEISRSKGMKEIDSLKMRNDLALDIMNDKNISNNTTKHICKVIKDMKRIMNTYKVDDYNIFAGPIFKDADNHLFVLDQIRSKTECDISVISNSEQRFKSYEAITSHPDFEKVISESAVVVDLGGASIQLTYFENGKLITTQHLRLGTVTVAENMRKLSRVIDAKDQVVEVVRKEIDNFRLMYLKNDNPKYIVIVGNHELISGNEGLEESYDMVISTITKTINAQDKFAPGLSICDGIAYEYCLKNDLIKKAHDFDEDILSAAWYISSKYGSYQPHLKALDSISMHIFDAMKKHHGLTSRERLLMRLTVILHDCGKYISLAESAECSRAIILSSEILGLTHKERLMIANVVAYNRIELDSYEELSDVFTEEEYVVMVKLLAILKVANALDRSHKQKLKNYTMTVKDDLLVINIESTDSIALEKGLFSKKADFFESIFAIRPVLKEKRV